MADTAPRSQWPHPPSRQLTTPPTPLTTLPINTHTVCRARSSVALITINTFVVGYMGRHTEGGAEEEDVTSEEETAIYGGQRTTRSHKSESVLGMRESEEGAFIMSLLCA